MQPSNKPLTQNPLVRFALLTSALVCLGGCVAEEPAHGTVYVQPAPPSGDGEVVYAQPPPPQEEIIVERPSPAHVWVKGYWGLRGRQRIWLTGHWELPPQPGFVWIEPRWEHRDRGYVFVAGSWRHGPAVVRERVAIQPSVKVNLSFVPQAPPAPPREKMIERVRPSRDHVWIKGYYVWREGRHFWVAGHWERRPRPNAIWVEPRWEHHPEGYVFIKGYWR